jgi:protein-disulfide isomerase
MSSESAPDTATAVPDAGAPVSGTPLETVRPAPVVPPTVGDSAAAAGRPLWTAFLTPAAVLLGSLVIGAAILASNGARTGAGGTAVGPATAASPAASPAASSTAVMPTTVPTPVPTPGQAASQLFAGYAGELGLDVAAFRTCLADPAMEKAVRDQQAVGAAAGVSGTPTTFVNDKKVVGAQPASIFEEVITAELADSPTTLAGYSDAVKALAAMTPPRFEITGKRPATTGAVVDGAPDAAVLVVEFSDYACPYCQRWEKENGPRIPSAWPGRVAFAYLDFPLDGLHPNAVAASVAAGCAARQDRFWQMHDLLFNRQADWAGAPGE